MKTYRCNAIAVITGLLLLMLGVLPAQALRIYAAAGTSGAITELAALYKKEQGVEVTPVFASSSALARQIIAGALFDLYVSANPKWMDAAENAGVVDRQRRVDLLTTQLVVIAPFGSGLLVKPEPDFPFAQSFSGRLAIGEPDSVPAGAYARAALRALGWWPRLESRLLPCRNVKAALRVVELGEAEAGIVYHADALASERVQVVAVLPCPEPIVFTVAPAAQASSESHAFYEWLLSAEAAEVFARHGFTRISKVGTDRPDAP